jgi:hypothetical protein
VYTMVGSPGLCTVSFPYVRMREGFPNVRNIFRKYEGQGVPSAYTESFPYVREGISERSEDFPYVRASGGSSTYKREWCRVLKVRLLFLNVQGGAPKPRR